MLVGDGKCSVIVRCIDMYLESHKSGRIILYKHIYFLDIRVGLSC